MDSAKLIAQDALKTIRASADQVAEMIQATKNAEKEVEKLNIELFNLEAQDTKRRAYMKNCIRAQELKNEELRSSIKQLKVSNFNSWPNFLHNLSLCRKNAKK